MFYAYAALAALQVVGGFQQADIIRQNGDLQADIKDMNAKFADVDAYNALESGYGNAARYEAGVNSTIAADRGAYSSEGVSVGYGTAQQVQDDNRLAGKINVLQIQRQARDASMGYQAQAINIRLGGQMTQLQAGLDAASTQSQGMFKGASTALTGYGMDISTGPGKDSKTGTNDQAWKTGSSTIHANNAGDGVTAPPHLYDNGFGWYPDKSQSGNNGQPGFFGKGPRSSSGFDESLGHYSFTGETGG